MEKEVQMVLTKEIVISTETKKAVLEDIVEDISKDLGFPLVEEVKPLSWESEDTSDSYIAVQEGTYQQVMDPKSYQEFPSSEELQPMWYSAKLMGSKEDDTDEQGYR